MSTWVIISWVLVLILTAINVVVFLKLKQAVEPMLKMAFPGSKNMGDAMMQMQKMMGGAGGGMPGMPAMGRGKPARGGGGNPFAGAGGGGGRPGGNGSDAQLKAAMEMLQKMQKGGKR